jgi:hypothetical protein
MEHTPPAPILLQICDYRHLLLHLVDLMAEACMYEEIVMLGRVNRATRYALMHTLEEIRSNSYIPGKPGPCHILKQYFPMGFFRKPYCYRNWVSNVPHRDLRKFFLLPDKPTAPNLDGLCVIDTTEKDDLPLCEHQFDMWGTLYQQYLQVKEIHMASLDKGHVFVDGTGPYCLMGYQHKLGEGFDHYYMFHINATKRPQYRRMADWKQTDRAVLYMYTSRLPADTRDTEALNRELSDVLGRFKRHKNSMFSTSEFKVDVEMAQRASGYVILKLLTQTAVLALNEKGFV